jgi:hypothetical protein
MTLCWCILEGSATSKRTHRTHLCLSTLNPKCHSLQWNILISVSNFQEDPQDPPIPLYPQPYKSQSALEHSHLYQRLPRGPTGPTYTSLPLTLNVTVCTGIFSSESAPSKRTHRTHLYLSTLSPICHSLHWNILICISNVQEDPQDRLMPLPLTLKVTVCMHWSILISVSNFQEDPPIPLNPCPTCQASTGTFSSVSATSKRTHRTHLYLSSTLNPTCHSLH